MKQSFNFIMFLSAILLASCSNEENAILEPSLPEDPSIVTNEDSMKTGVNVSLPELIDGNAVNDGEGVATRSTIAYDYNVKKMLFSWGEVDKEAYICVFAQNKNVMEGLKDVVTPQVYTRKAGQNKTALSCTFEGPTSIKALDQKDNDGDVINYIAFRPYTVNGYNSPDLNYLTKSISYEGQSNSVSAKVAKRTSSDNYAAYNASEKEASSHLGTYDYLVSEPTPTRDEEGNIFFALKRIGVTARFYLKCPAAEVFEQLELVTKNTELFTLEGTMDLSSMKVTDDDQSITITPTKQSNVITLSYDYDASDETNHPGLDMTNTDYYNTKGVGYIISYMMLPPVDLSTAVPSGSTNDVYLYLVSHTKDKPTEKHYYKSASLNKPKLTSNMFYQWTYTDNTVSPEPITFSEVTVQQWQDDTAVDNGTDGTGTEGW